MTVPRRALIDDADYPPVVGCDPKRAAEPSGADVAFSGDRPKVATWKRSVAPLAAMAVLSTAVAFGVTASHAAVASVADGPDVALSTSTPDAALGSLRGEGMSRSSRGEDREPVDAASLALPGEGETVAPQPPQPPSPAPEAKVVGKKYAKSDGINVRETPSDSGKILGKLDRSTEVQITDARSGNWQQVSWQQGTAWVSSDLLVDAKPTAADPKDTLVPSGGEFSTAPCQHGSAIEGGITPNTKRAFRAFCAVFPEIKTYGGYRNAESWSYHTKGAAIDAMVSDQTLGWKMAKWAAANADALHIDQVFYAKSVWTKTNRTWRPVADRGSVTANHLDHVHLSVGG